MFGDLLISSGKPCSNTLTTLDIFKDGSCYATYPLDGDSSDLGGTYNGVDTSIAYGQGLLYDAAKFNQTLAQRITLPFTYANDTPYSVSGFFTAGVNNVSGSALGEGNAVFSIGNGTTTDTAMLVIIDSTSVLFLMYGATTSNQIRVTATIALEDTEYHHIAVTYDGSKLASGMQIFIDGKLLPVTELDASYTGVNTSSPNFIIGSVFWADASYYRTMNGLVDHVRYFNRVLTTSEVEMLALEGPYLCDPTPQDYIAYYPLTGTAEDKTGNNDGTENGGLLYIDDIIRGSVPNLDGINDYISMSDAGFPLGSTDRTISLWAKCSSLSTSNSLVQYGTNSTGNYFTIYVDTAGAVFVGISSSNTSTSTGVVTAGEWVHITAVLNGTTIDDIKIFIESIDQSLTVLASGTTVNTLSNIGLFGFNNTTIYMSGNIANVRIYGRALSPVEISAIYNYEKVTHPIAIDSGLIAYYPLASNSWDNYFNQYDGTDTGMVYDGLSGTFGTGANVNIDAYTANTIVSTTDWTISLWMKASLITGTASDGAITFGGSANGVGVGILKTTGKIGIGGSLADVNTIVAGTTTANTAVWYLVTVTRYSSDGATSVYVNGILEATGTINHGNGTDLDRIGGNTSNNPLDSTASVDAIFDGNIAKTRLYHRVITSEEVLTIYNSERGDFGI